MKEFPPLIGCVLLWGFFELSKTIIRSKSWISEGESFLHIFHSNKRKITMICGNQIMQRNHAYDFSKLITIALIMSFIYGVNKIVN